MKYSEIRNSLRTGDIVLFRGKGLVSNVIMRVCTFFSVLFGGKKSTYSHVGGVVRISSDRVFIFESTTLNGKSGVQLNLLSDVVTQYKGKIVIRKLRMERTPEMLCRLEKFISDNLGKPYEKYIWELVGAATPWHVFSGSNKYYFCSELWAKIYMMWGLIPNDLPAKEYKPDDFGFCGKIDWRMAHSTTWARLGEEIKITK